MKTGPFALLTAAFFGLPGVALGQTPTGNLYAKAADEQGGAVPGVSVTLSGIGGAVAQTTDVRGEVRFLSLSPGLYALDFRLQGFAKVTRKNVTVSVNENTQINVTMKLAGVQESVVVTGESPLLDARKSGARAVVSKSELESIPTARDPWAILQSVPGLQLDRVNVGGSESGQQAIYVSKGADVSQGTWNIDGVNITDMSALGGSPMYYDFDSFAEMNVVTGGADVSIPTPGVQINMVTKRGTNDVHGSARLYGTSNKLQSTNISSELAAQLTLTGQAAIANQIQSIQDWGADLGGPIVKDKIWLWGSYGRNQINTLTAGGYHDDTILEEFGGKLNAQAVPENSFTAVYSHADKRKVGRDVGPTMPPETAWNQSGPVKFYRLEDSHIFSSDVFATVAYSRVIGGFSLTTPGQTQAYLDESGIWHNSYFQYSTSRPQTQVNVTPSFFLRTGSVGHEIKVGFNYRSTPNSSATAWPQGIVGYAPGYGFTDQGNASFIRPGVRKASQNYYSGYLSDTMTASKLTINLGLRYDYQQSSNQPLTVPCCDYSSTTWPEVPFASLTVAGTSSLIWRDVSPRLGLAYVLGDQGKTLIKASYARFVDQLGGDVSAYDSNAPYGPSGLYYNWNDANGNGIVEPGEVDFAGGIVGSSYVDPIDPNKSTAINATNYRMRAPAVDEFLLGVEHELMPAFVMGLGGTYRHLGNFLYTPGLNAVTGQILASSDFTCSPAGPFPVPGGTPQMINVCSLNAGISSGSGYQTNRPGYYQTFWSVDLSATKRYSDRWMARFNFSYQGWHQYGLGDGQSDPSNLNPGTETEGGVVTSAAGTFSNKQYVFINSRWLATLSGRYTFPTDVNLSTSLYLREGYPVPYFSQQTATGPTGYPARQQYTLGLVGAYRLNTVFEWDLGVSKVVKVGPLNITIVADVFNVLNRNTVLQRTTRIYDEAGTPQAVDPRDNHINEQQAPRIWRFGVRLSF